MTNNILSLRRTSDYFINEIGCNGRKLMLYGAIMTGMLIFIALLNSLVNSYTYDSFYDSIIDKALVNLVAFYSILFIIFGCLSASLMWGGDEK